MQIFPLPKTLMRALVDINMGNPPVALIASSQQLYSTHQQVKILSPHSGFPILSLHEGFSFRC